MATKDNIRVVVRFRPTRSNRKQVEDHLPVDWDAKSNLVFVPGKSGRKPNEFSFDLVLGPSVSQEQFFIQVAEDRCRSVLEGFNVTLFCYGQSGSGKTHTMFGPDAEYLDPKQTMKSMQMGLIPRAVSFIFNYVESIDSDPNIDSITVKAACLEVYMEKMRDLLDPTSKKDLKILQNKSKGTYVNKLSWKTILQPMDVIKCIIISMQNRHIESTNLNATSSRSHAIISLEVTKRLTDNRGETKALVHFCDLAGSEKLKNTGAQGLTAKQGMMINKSLFSLGAVIQKLSRGASYIPYRDSVLTKVLQDALGGNSKTTLIVAASYHSLSREETLSSMRFAKSCKTIKNKAKANILHSTKELYMKIQRLEEEIERLNQIIKRNAKEGGKASKELQSVFHAQLEAVNEDKKKVLADFEEAKVEIKGREARIDEMTREFLQVSSKLEEAKDKINISEDINSELKKKIAELESTISFHKEAEEANNLKEQSKQREIYGLKMQIKIAVEQQEQAMLMARSQSLELTGTKEELQKEMQRMRASILEFENLANSHSENYESLRQEKIATADELDRVKLAFQTEKERLAGLIEEKGVELEKFKKESEAIRLELEHLLTEQTQQLKKEAIAMEENLQRSLNSKNCELELKNEIISKLEKQIADSGKIDDLKQTFLSSLTMMKKEQEKSEEHKVSQAVQAEILELKKSIEQMKQDQLGAILKQQSFRGGFHIGDQRTRKRSNTHGGTMRTYSTRAGNFMSAQGFSMGENSKEDLVIRKAAQMTEMLAIRSHLLEADSKVAEELAAQYDRELMEEQNKRQQIEEDDAKFVQWLANNEHDGMEYLNKEIPEEVKMIMKILRIDRELTSLEYAQLIEYHEENAHWKDKNDSDMIKSPSLREFQRSEFDNGEAPKVSECQLERELSAKERHDLFNFKNMDSSAEEEKRFSVFDSYKNLVEAQESRFSKLSSPLSLEDTRVYSAPTKTGLGWRNSSSPAADRGSLRPSNSVENKRDHSKSSAPFKECILASNVSWLSLDGDSDFPSVPLVESKRREQRKSRGRKRKKRKQYTGTFNPMYKLGGRLYTGGTRCQVEMVKEGGQLHSIGLKSRSIITKINNMRIWHCEDFTTALQLLRSKQIVEAKIMWRDEELPPKPPQNIEDEFSDLLTALSISSRE